MKKSCARGRRGHGDDRLSLYDPAEPAGASRDALCGLNITHAQVLLRLLLLGAVPARVQARQRRQRAGEAAPPRRRYAWHVGWPGPSGEAEAARSPRVVARVTRLDRMYIGMSLSTMYSAMLGCLSKDVMSAVGQEYGTIRVAWDSTLSGMMVPPRRRSLIS